jgi:hypothetical protein
MKFGELTYIMRDHIHQGAELNFRSHTMLEDKMVKSQSKPRVTVIGCLYFLAKFDS